MESMTSVSSLEKDGVNPEKFKQNVLSIIE